MPADPPPHRPGSDATRQADSTSDPVAPTRDDPWVAASCEGLGGIAGRRVRPAAGWWTPLRVLLAATVVVCAVGFLSKDYCRDRAWPREAGLEYVHGCYSDIPHLYLERGLAAGALPYLDDLGTYPPVEYPVLTGLAMALTAPLARAADPVANEVRRYFDVNVLLLTLAALVTVAATARAAGRRPWDAAIVALAPTLALSGFINWDLLAVALTALAVLAWARERPALAGALLGLGAAVKLYPVLLLGPLLLLCLRAGRLDAAARATAAAAAAWVVVNLPVALLAPAGWSSFYRFNSERSADFGSIWRIWYDGGVADRLGVLTDPASINVLAAATFLLACAGIAVLALRAPRRPRLAALAFLTVAAFVTANKVYSPQYVLWLLPLAALARPRWRDITVWQAGEVVYWLAVWLWLAGASRPDRALPDPTYAQLILLRIAALGWLAAMVVRDVLQPEHDPVRGDGVTDDPAGGVLDGAADVVTVAPAGAERS